MRVDEQTIEFDSSPVFYRSASGAGTPSIYLHGVPTSSDDWVEFLERTGGIAPDLIGFGRSGKAGNLDYTLVGLEQFLERLLDHLELRLVNLIGHDWGGAVALAFALAHPDRVSRIVLLNSVPLVDTAFRWHRAARLWRRPLLGELAMGATTKWLLARGLQSGTITKDAWPKTSTDAIWRYFDQGTQRAILRLYRDADEDKLRHAGAQLENLTRRALIVWGQRDPWLPPSIGEAFAHALPNATLERIEDAGHWPWLDDPTVIDRVSSFLGTQ